MDTTRQHFALTQARYAAWLGENRSTVAMVEAGHRNAPLRIGNRQAMRLDLATLGKTFTPQNELLTFPALPEPAPERGPLNYRLRQVRHQLANLRYRLESLRRQAQPYHNRLLAVPALRAWPGPSANPEREQRWLDSFEQEARHELLNVCGAGPQQLLQARLAGLERETQWLEEVLNALPPADLPPAG
ncbi:hypothetical protein [Hymenobacter rubripertinctus]|uniref:Uncharacterized protein n=1 Tax=Hymenobacter rubripertinctus TaxID=2029981 RepID=A0A418QYL2_9BACT|nr:hypothetical protein [Hymenobacter rubripertinctus]RIY10244.1 hypothetical protein D0T11_10350 [Hymenobacter rubripertinctus]